MSFSDEQLNSLINMANEKIMCDANCQKNKQVSGLYKEYLNAQNNYLNGPEQVLIAQKNYYTKEFGTSEYNNLNKEQLTIVSDIISEKLSKQFKEKINWAYKLNNIYNTDYINSQNTKDLYNYYIDKNKNVSFKVTEASSDIFTNDRKAYYESLQLEDLEWWYTIEISIYALTVLAFIVFSIFGASVVSRFRLFATIIFIILYPFISTFLGLKILFVVNWVYSFFPKNVYLDSY